MKPSNQDRILAVLAHLSALAFGSGIIIPAALWSENRKKSAYLRFQALQAYGYQSLGYTLWLLSVLLLTLLFYLALLVMALLIPASAPTETALAALSIVVIVLLFGSMGLYLLLPLIGAAMCGLGIDFRYPLLGNRLARSLAYQQNEPGASLDSAFEERFAAAMGHFAVILSIWGLLAPAWLWLSNKNHSPWLKFQSAQTALYQIFVNLAYLGISFGAIFIAAFTTILFSVPSGPSDFSIAIGILTASLAFACLSLLIPLFHILGQWAGLQTLRGRDFKYPLLGRWVEKFLK